MRHIHTYILDINEIKETKTQKKHFSKHLYRYTDTLTNTQFLRKYTRIHTHTKTQKRVVRVATINMRKIVEPIKPMQKHVLTYLLILSFDGNGN